MIPTAADWVAELDRHGYCTVPNAISPGTVHELNQDLDPIFEATPFCDGDFYGRSTKRLGSLLKRSVHADKLVRHSLILEIANAILLPWCDRINLNLTQAIEIHPGAPTQYPHRDQDMWQGAKGEIQYLVNVMWPLSRFSKENGATMIWPQSHDPANLAGGQRSCPPVSAKMEPGSVLLFLGSTLHCGGANSTGEIRRGIIISYCLGWLKPFENQWLIYPPEIARTFDPELATLVGYAQHRPNLGNVEGQCPSTLLRPDPPAHPAATDALRPDQAEALAEFVNSGSQVSDSR
jgi:ectoine hydroxylase-related dioxygenase (phytanoyl-CoA dioxygenase family)